MIQLTELVIEAESWNSALPDLEVIAEEAALLTLDVVDISAANHEICILACDDARIAALNADFRGKPQPTNVLSWPAHDLAVATPGGIPVAPPPGPLGDIALALETVTREAQSANRPLKSHATHLILHGVLHLLGYDHQNDEDARLMEGIETRALNLLEIPDPYA